jgi:uroporphyrinogen decarboxylase
MTPRERLLSALAHQEPDRVPIDLGGTDVTTIAASTYARVREVLGLPTEEIALYDYSKQMAYLSEDLLERLSVDTRMVQLPRKYAKTPKVFDDGDCWAYIDRWGCKRQMPKDNGFYFDRVEFPIREASLEGLADYSWPAAWKTPPELRDVARRLREATDYAVVGGSDLGGAGVFEQSWKMVGLEEGLMAMYSDRPFADRLVDRVTESYMEATSEYLDQVGEYIDVFMFGDDICAQDSWIISPKLYVELIKPRHRRVFDLVKQKTAAKIFYHSCGAVFDLIPHLIDVGVDIVNPVQVSARGMDTKRLKATYGRDVTFWGGSVDTQHTLPFGTPQEVADEVKRRIDDLAPGGGFVFSSIHNIQALVPPENVVAAFDTAAGYGGYKV